jgi:hypothetical protein
LRKTRKDIENKQTAKRYAHACVVVVAEANGRYLVMAPMVCLRRPMCLLESAIVRLN